MNFNPQRINTSKLALLMILPAASVLNLRSTLRGTLSELFSLRLFISNTAYLQFILHLRLSTAFYTPQSLEMFAYQTSTVGSNIMNSQFYLTQSGLGLSLNTQSSFESSSDSRALQRHSIQSADKLFQNY